jgi:hypothetical protein
MTYRFSISRLTLQPLRTRSPAYRASLALLVVRCMPARRKVASCCRMSRCRSCCWWLGNRDTSVCVQLE